MEEKFKDFARQREAALGDNLTYCKHPEYYELDWSGVHHGDFQCSFLEAASLFVNGESQAFVTTSMRVEKLHYYSKPVNAECSDIEGTRLTGSLTDICAYTEAQSYFPVGPENVTLNFIHGYRTSSIVDKKGSLPRTIIKSPGFSDNQLEIKAGKEIKLTLKQLLDIAGIDLDKRLNEQDNNPCSDTSQGNSTNGRVEYPRGRLSGLILQLTFNYYTRKLAPEAYKKDTGENSEAVVCILEVVPQNRWSLLGSDIRYMMNKPSDPLFITTDHVGRVANDDQELLASRTDFQRNGVALVFTTSGSIGRFDFGALINALVAGSVLLAVAQMITTYIAIYALGLSSQLYKAFMMETVDWRQEYARYAAQAIVAGHAFMQYDDNRSMKLDRKEIFDVLKKLMSKDDDMENWQLAALADFLMRQGDKGADTHKGRFDATHKVRENYIDIEEWIDIFTEEKATWPLLQRLIEEEYPDEESRNKVENLLLRTSQKRTLDVNSQRDAENEISGEEGEGNTPVSGAKPAVVFDRSSTFPYPPNKSETTELRGMEARGSLSFSHRPTTTTTNLDIERGVRTPLLPMDEELTDEDILDPKRRT